MSVSGPGSVAGGVELQYLLVLISVVLASCIAATLISLRYEKTKKTKYFKLHLSDEDSEKADIGRVLRELRSDRSDRF